MRFDSFALCSEESAKFALGIKVGAKLLVRMCSHGLTMFG